MFKLYNVLNGLLMDKKGGEIFTLFSGWHFLFIGFTIITIALVLLLLRNKSEKEKKMTTKVFIYIAFGLYMADFFLMPLAYGEIDIEKLPFHACTAMCLMSFLSYHNKFLEKFRLSFALFGLLSNLVYLAYPAGVMWYAVHPTSYRAIQTLLFHSVMTIYGILILVTEHKNFDIKKSYRDIAVTVCMTVWALIGSYVYSGNTDGYNRYFNWFFVIRDPLSWFPEDISPYIMPFINIAVFSAVQMLAHFVIWLINRKQKTVATVDN